VPGGDPRARRPTVDSRVSRAGCLGVSRVARGLPLALHRLRGGREGADAGQAPEPGANAPSSGRVTLADTATPDITVPNLPASDTVTALAPHARTASAITIFVCVTCRGGRPLDLVPVPGEVLAAATLRAAEGTGVTVCPIRCLANCNRGLSAAVRRDGAWTYVFGNLDPLGGADALIEGAKLFAGAPDGLMPWRGRPDALKRGLVARTPPFDFAGDRR
jgi:predicted metal-binding protein